MASAWIVPALDGGEDGRAGCRFGIDLAPLQLLAFEGGELALAVRRDGPPPVRGARRTRCRSRLRPTPSTGAQFSAICPRTMARAGYSNPAQAGMQGVSATQSMSARLARTLQSIRPRDGRRRVSRHVTCGPSAPAHAGIARLFNHFLEAPAADRHTAVDQLSVAARGRHSFLWRRCGFGG